MKLLLKQLQYCILKYILFSLENYESHSMQWKTMQKTNKYIKNIPSKIENKQP